MKFLNELGIWAIMPIFLENVGPVQGFKQKTFTNYKKNQNLSSLVKINCHERVTRIIACPTEGIVCHRHSLAFPKS